MFEHLVATLQTLPVPYYETDYLYRQMVNLLLTMTTASVLSRVRLFMTPWALAHQTPPSMELSRQEYWNGLPFPSPGILWPRDWTLVSCVSCIGNHILYHGFPVPPCATWEAQIQKRPKAVLWLTQPLGIPSFRELNLVNLLKNLGTKCKLTVFLHCS